MRKLKWVLLALLFLQLPFAYKLLQSYAVRGYLKHFSQQLRPQTTPFQDWRGAVHIHSAAGGHSLGTYPEIIRVARQLEYDYLFITEHPREERLFVPLQAQNLAIIYGWERHEEGVEYLTDDAETFRVVTEIEKGVPAADFDGMEVYNLHENAVHADSWFNRLNFVYHQLLFSDLFYFQLWDVNRDRIRDWENRLNLGHLTATAGNDAHQNVGVILQTTAGQRILSIMVDPYLASLAFVTTHVLSNLGTEPDATNVLNSLKSGSAYIAFEQIGDPTGFAFYALEGSTWRPMGSRVGGNADLVLQAPAPVRFRLYRGGDVFRELEGSRFTVEGPGRGIYRVEVYLLDPPSLLDGKPWILSNPIYIQ